MAKSEILYEPLSIARIGINKSTEELFIANDFSGFAQMLEEYICLGAIKIIIPVSSPEVSTLNQMPSLLKKRIKIIDDSNEIETVNRLLYNIRKEFNAKIVEDTHYIKFPNNTPRALIKHIDQIHLDIKKLALGFNHNIQVPLSHESTLSSISFLRSKVHDPTSRLVLAQLESILNHYEKIEFKAIISQNSNLPIELMSIFDRLINDENYLQYSEAIYQLSSPLTRYNAKLKLKELSRIITSKSYLGKGWDYLTKVITAWKGIPLPESKDLANLINGDNLPSLVNLIDSKKRAIEIWNNTNLNTKPLSRGGISLGDDKIIWFPPFDDMRIQAEDDKIHSFGKFRTLVENVNKALKQANDEKFK